MKTKVIQFTRNGRPKTKPKNQFLISLFIVCQRCLNHIPACAHSVEEAIKDLRNMPPHVCTPPRRAS